MGSECSEDEREVRYKEFHKAIYTIENDIKNDLLNPDRSKKKYMPFGLVNKGICQKYTFLLDENFNKNEARNAVFNYKELVKKNEHVDFSYANKNKKYSFYLPSNFMFVNQDFLYVIGEYIPTKYKSQLSTIFNTIIGGECLIMKDAKDYNDEESLRYIILYYEIKEDFGNEIDFIIDIKDKKERLAADEYILKHNLWNYFKKINYDYKFITVMDKRLDVLSVVVMLQE